MQMKGDMNIVSLWPSWPTIQRSAYTIHQSDVILRIKDWRKVLKDRRELLGGQHQAQPTNGETCSSVFSIMEVLGSYVLHCARMMS